jgi:hypothetical protein
MNILLNLVASVDDRLEDVDICVEYGEALHCLREENLLL